MPEINIYNIIVFTLTFVALVFGAIKAVAGTTKTQKVIGVIIVLVGLLSAAFHWYDSRSIVSIIKPSNNGSVKIISETNGTGKFLVIVQSKNIPANMEVALYIHQVTRGENVWFRVVDYNPHNASDQTWSFNAWPGSVEQLPALNEELELIALMGKSENFKNKSINENINALTHTDVVNNNWHRKSEIIKVKIGSINPRN